MAEMSLKPVDLVEILSIMDNSIDVLMAVAINRVRA